MDRDIEKGSKDDDKNVIVPLIQSDTDVNDDDDDRRDRVADEMKGTNRPLNFTQPLNKNYSKPSLEETSSVLSLPWTTPAASPNIGSIIDFPARFRRDDRKRRRLNTELLEAVTQGDLEETLSLINEGASPNATCRKAYVSVCHIAALRGLHDILTLLITKGAERKRLDILGRTPLHLAIFGGHIKCVAILLDIPEDILKTVNDDCFSDAEEEIRSHSFKYKELVNIRCKESDGIVIPQHWKDSIEHECLDIKHAIPIIEEGMTPLHVATARTRPHCTKFLLDSLADTSIVDAKGRTAFDVMGLAFKSSPEQFNMNDFNTVLTELIKNNALHNTMRIDGLNNIPTPLHIAVEFDSVEAIEALVDYGVYPGSFDQDGETPLHLCVHNENEDALQILINGYAREQETISHTVDMKNRHGLTLLQLAVTKQWVAGVCMALEAGADVASQSNNGDTVLHTAASHNRNELLEEVLSVNKDLEVIELVNTKGETALFSAVSTGSVDCVTSLIKAGASIKHKIPGDINMLHKAAEYGHIDVLRELLEADTNGELINSLTDSESLGYAPIHFAAAGNNSECVSLLLKYGANIRTRTTHKPHFQATALHLAAYYGHKDVAEVILKYDPNTVHEVELHGWLPIHVAAHNANRDIITILLQYGADLSSTFTDPKGNKRTAIEIIIHNVPRPLNYLEQLLDSYITSNNLSLEEIDCEIIVDYSVLMPKKSDMEQMKVITSLLNTGNRFGQKKLLLHPLIESFLYLKWGALSPFFYLILTCYAFFVVSLTSLIISLFYYKDNNLKTPVYFDAFFWMILLYISVLCIVLEEILYITQNTTKYFLNLETWIKFGSISISLVIPFVNEIGKNEDWPRHLATLALLLAWIELMFLLSRFPNWGYYVLMFGKVAMNVVKILSTFLFLLIGFSLSFMIQFHSKDPFETPWTSIIKTIVMMTSEFDYSQLFDEQHTRDIGTSSLVGKFVFIAFLILASIVLMNLLVGVAVNDITDLEIQGNIQRLAKQVDFLGTLDVMVYNKIFSFFLTKKLNRKIRTKRNVCKKMIIYPGRPGWKYEKNLPNHLKDSVLSVITQNNVSEERVMMTAIASDIGAIRNELNKIPNIDDESLNRRKKLDEMMEYFNELKMDVKNLKSDVFDLKIDEISNAVMRLEENFKILEMKVDRLS